MDALSRHHAGGNADDAKRRRRRLQLKGSLPMNAKRSLRAYRGFSLVEVMVALAITAVGLLGLAKMESLAVSSTQVASARSLAAIQASSLAAAMHANPGYWASGVVPTTPTTVTMSGGVMTVVSADPNLAGAATAGACLTS